MTKIEFKKIGINGEGIGYLDKTPVFCDGVLPGETADVLIEQGEERYHRAKLREVLIPSLDRVEPVCPYARECGGCGMMHASYDAQLQYKKQLLEEALWKYGHVKRELVRDVHPAEHIIHYRTSCKLPVQEADGKLVSGMYRPNTNHFVPISHCPAHTTELEETRIAVLDVLNRHHLKAFDAKTKKGIRYIVLRTIQGNSQLTLVTGNDLLSAECIHDLMTIPGMKSLSRSTNTRRKGPSIFGTTPAILAGDKTLMFHINGLELQLSPESFFQLNVDQAEKLYAETIAHVDNCKTLVENYCGVGAMSLMAAKKVQHTIGIEVIDKAVQNAAANAERNQIGNARFFTADAAEGYREIARKRKIDSLLIDPPRSGMDDALLKAVSENQPDRIIYVSCNPATLARNIMELKHADYQVRTVIPFDMFPNTPHVESITVLTK